ncbi:hypothetical protein RhiirA5_442505 [Rhizophagus irregularis]|uniref:Uncharacterized protein n=1 Tax=Rhizophagus irregularis TaxID=588596 RepID=A0A2N0NES2_9GLOM|nr:hypothetical protein RhiirA5_442505 [Rhizophagus irregularis]GBC53911.2 hypothetical protein RIR_jg15886.t1 [Rhizophagus irregularis DAOM 181602=DAOM 197198]GET51006.1 hypothetical protein RIR_jg19011.t1 [Rhizophagus irregularis DAOM 181602=DAOM 197198]GET54548.1 hypothetical protein RIR_jg4302.t1 [Rhizophagus irregularis DAOM 181602=DAOM 197198]GET56604.1 hypothetical protein RIR_jg14773.t1 [Rhizophagus irregularis DAOM 181602=DAOM 197198]
MIKTLQPAYNLLPTRQILSGTLLQAELARVNLRIYNELAKETNCTIDSHDHFISSMGPHRRIISQNHPSILDIRCIARCVNLISSDMIKCANVISQDFSKIRL